MKRSFATAAIRAMAGWLCAAAVALGCGFPHVDYDAEVIEGADASSLDRGNSSTPGVRNGAREAGAADAIVVAPTDGADDGAGALLIPTGADASADVVDASSAVDDDASSPEQNGEDGALPAPDAARTTDAGTNPDSAAATPPPPPPVCDVDNDTYRAEGAVCGGSDCDDSDPRANPGVTQFLTDPPTAATGGDWNCDGTVERQYPSNVACPLATLASCDTIAGFATADPGCGVAGVFVQCVRLGNGNGKIKLCEEGSLTVVVQGCR